MQICACDGVGRFRLSLTWCSIVKGLWHPRCHGSCWAPAPQCVVGCNGISGATSVGWAKWSFFLQRLGEEIVRTSAEICSESRKQEQCVDNRSYESKWNLGIILVSISIPGLLVFVGYWCYRRGTQRPGTSEPSGGSTPTSPDQRRELAPQQIVEVRARSRIEVCYDVPGPTLWHERLVLHHITNDDYVVASPDSEVFLSRAISIESRSPRDTGQASSQCFASWSQRWGGLLPPDVHCWPADSSSRRGHSCLGTRKASAWLGGGSG